MNANRYREYDSLWVLKGPEGDPGELLPSISVITTISQILPPHLSHIFSGHAKCMCRVICGVELVREQKEVKPLQFFP